MRVAWPWNPSITSAQRSVGARSNASMRTAIAASESSDKKADFQ